MSLEEKVAVFTGGACGMGRSMGPRFLDAGARVVVADFNESSGAATGYRGRSRQSGV